MKRNESGNVMFYILLAIALLAALTFAVSQSWRGGASDLSRDRQRLLTAEILEYSDTVKKAVQILRLRGIALNRVDFNDPALAGHDNAACTTDDCLIFNINGGGIIYKRASSDALVTAGDWLFTLNNEIDEVGTTSGTAAGADLLMILQPLKQVICENINDQLGIPNSGTGGGPPEDSEIDLSIPFTGSESYSKTIGDEAGATWLGPGFTAACFKDLTTGDFVFYQVLAAR